MGTPDSILVIRLSSLGDVLMSVPAVLALRRKLPRTHIAWLVEGSVGELLQHQSFVDEVIPFPRSRIESAMKSGRWLEAATELRRFTGRLRSRHYDTVLDFHGILKSALLGRAVRSGSRVGFTKDFAKEQSHLFYGERLGSPDRRIHKVDRNMLVARHLGANGSLPQVELRAPEEACKYIDTFLGATRMPAPLLAVNPFSSRGGRYKRWGIERYGELARRLAERTGGTPLILWGPGEEEEAGRLKELSGERAMLACRTTVPQLLALLKRVSLYIGGDSGVMHLAAFAGTPVVAIFGPTDHLVNGPRAEKGVMIRRDIPCSPCKNKECQDRKCLSAISVDEVFGASLGLLGGAGVN